MSKLHLSIHVDQNGQQTINSDGDPSLWPLVGRLAACHSQAKMLALFAVLDSGGAQAQAAKTESPPAREQGIVDETKDRIEDAIGNYGTALMSLGWSSKASNVVDWARAFAAEHGAMEEQMDLIDAILRPVVAADDGDSCTDLAGLARGELVAVRKELQATRAVLEEAIGLLPLMAMPIVTPTAVTPRRPSATAIPIFTPPGPAPARGPRPKRWRPAPSCAWAS